MKIAVWFACTFTTTRCIQMIIGKHRSKPVFSLTQIHCTISNNLCLRLSVGYVIYWSRKRFGCLVPYLGYNIICDRYYSWLVITSNNILWYWCKFPVQASAHGSRSAGCYSYGRMHAISSACNKTTTTNGVIFKGKTSRWAVYLVTCTKIIWRSRSSGDIRGHVATIYYTRAAH